MGWSRKRSALQAYFAGIFDGEGCVSVHHGSTVNTYSLGVTIQMDDPHAVFLLKQEYPDGLMRWHVDRRTGKGSWVFRLTHYKAFLFLEAIKPFVIVKHEQVKVALSFLAHRQRDHSPTKGFDCGGRCARFKALLSELKTRYKGMNSVNAEYHELREYRAKPEDVDADRRHLRRLAQKLQEGVTTSGEDSTVQ